MLTRPPLWMLYAVGAMFVAGCVSCHESRFTYTLDDTQIARVTEGTGSPTARGCDVVCDEVGQVYDAGSVDGGLPNPRRLVVGCALSGRQLTCDYGRICDV